MLSLQRPLWKCTYPHVQPCAHINISETQRRGWLVEGVTCILSGRDRVHVGQADLIHLSRVVLYHMPWLWLAEMEAAFIAFRTWVLFYLYFPPCNGLRLFYNSFEPYSPRHENENPRRVKWENSGNTCNTVKCCTKASGFTWVMIPSSPQQTQISWGFPVASPDPHVQMTIIRNSPKWEFGDAVCSW
jgi:hypothetical protein